MGKYTTYTTFLPGLHKISREHRFPYWTDFAKVLFFPSSLIFCNKLINQISLPQKNVPFTYIFHLKYSSVLSQGSK